MASPLRSQSSQLSLHATDKYEIYPEGNVYSYSMKSALQQRKKHGEFNLDGLVAHVLVVLVLCIQGTLLYCVYNKAVVKNVRWVGSIMRTEWSWALFAPPEDKCNTGSSLCTLENGVFACAPPSVKLIGRWDELDVDGDGIWTRAEAISHRDKLKCKYVVDPVEIFDIVVFFVRERMDLIWMHPDIRTGKAIHKAYFTFAMGDIAMCGYRNEDMCGNLMKRGVFDSAMKYNTSQRIGNTVKSALNYCRDMLGDNGYCVRQLPSTYATWKVESKEQCKEPKFKGFEYTNPINGDKKSLLEVDYEAREDYEDAQSARFQLYKGVISGIWMLLIVSQLRRVWRILCFVAFFPALHVVEEYEQDGSPVKRSPSGRHETVEGISWKDRCFLGAVTLMRLAMLGILGFVGLSFLARQNDYIDLLMDGVALIFIIEVQELVYERVLRDSVRSQWEETDFVTVDKLGIPFLNKRPDIADLVWLCAIVVGSYIFMHEFTKDMVVPIHNSLECACNVEGEHCYEATRFSKSFWDHYWQSDIPGVYDQVKKLRKGVGLLQRSTTHRTGVVPTRLGF